MAELHGGTIRAFSEGHGKGAELTLTLPLTPAPSRLHPRRAPPPLAAAGLSGVTVLVVEDEPDARELAQRILEEHGASVVAAESGPEALAVLAERTPDVLVSDISMPGMDGYELVHRLRAHRDTQKRAVPAVALTAFARSEDRLRAQAAGFQAHVTKPIEPAVLIAAVGMLCPSPSGDGHG
jgi:CheY-like chemotaxis protein